MRHAHLWYHKLQWNVLKIVIGVYFQSHKDYIIPYISIKFYVVVAKVIKLHCGENYSWIAATKLDSQFLIEKKQHTSWLITATKEVLRTWGRCCALYWIFVTSFQQDKQYFSCVNVGKKLSHVEVTCSCFEALVAVCCLLTKCLAVLVMSNGCSDCHLLQI